AVGYRRAAVHGDHRVVDFSLGYGDRLQHPEERHGARDVGEQVEVETRTTHGADDAPHLLLFDAFITQLHSQAFETLRDRLVEIGFQIHQIRNHHHHAVAVAQVFDVARAFDKIEQLEGFFIHRRQ